MRTSQKPSACRKRPRYPLWLRTEHQTRRFWGFWSPNRGGYQPNADFLRTLRGPRKRSHFGGVAAPSITHRPPQALTNMISSTSEAAEEFKRGLSRPRGTTTSPNSKFAIPTSQLGELPLELGGFRNVLDLHTPDPLRYRQPRCAGDFLLVGVVGVLSNLSTGWSAPVGVGACGFKIG